MITYRAKQGSCLNAWPLICGTSSVAVAKVKKAKEVKPLKVVTQ